jgi:hypothetical protein
MRWSTLVGAVLCVALVGCGSEDEGCPDGPRDFVREVDGRTSLYSGCEVTRELGDTGAFEPDPGEAYELLELPSKLIPSNPSDPTTVSLCDPAWDVHVEFHAGYCPGTELPDPNNPVWTAVSPDDCIVHGDSGQTGVFGLVQIVRQPDGQLIWAHAFAADVYYESERGTLDGFGYSEFAAGVVADDELEDPLLAEPCGCSIEEPCPRPDPPPGN